MEKRSVSANASRFLFLTLGALLFAAMLLVNPFGLDPKATKVAAIALLMVVWWVSEALPMPVVALLPLILFPIMGIASPAEAAAPYANPVIFLFMGGFMIGLAIEKWNLHKRIALSIVSRTGTKGNRIVLGFIIATGGLSMWLSNTATAMMMYPIAISVISVMEETSGSDTKASSNLAICLLLSIAYACNLGGLATIIGSPSNVAYAAFLESESGQAISFMQWFQFCLPLAAVLMTVLYFMLTKVLYPIRNSNTSNTLADDSIRTELSKMGKLTVPEKRVLVIFLLTAFLWMAKGVINSAQSVLVLDDSMIAINGAVLLFLTPADSKRQLLEWPDTGKMAWGILLLFGGGISLAGQLEESGVVQILGEWIGGYASPGFWLLAIVTVFSIFLTELISNTAQVIVFAPVVAGLAEAVQMDPIQLGIAMTLAASCAGMLPMGTPPNAIVFASGKLRLKHMVTAGLVMNFICAAIIILFCWYLYPILF